MFSVSVGGMTCDITAITENEVYYLCVNTSWLFVVCKQELSQYIIVLIMLELAQCCSRKKNNSYLPTSQ